MGRPDILLGHENRISVMEGITSEIRETLHRIDTRLNGMDTRIDGLNVRIDDTNKRIDSLGNKALIGMLAITSAMIAGFVGLAAAIITAR